MEIVCCPSCGLEQRVEDNYCLRCGVNMYIFAANHEAPMICPRCRQSTDGHFCTSCGIKLIGKSLYTRRKFLGYIYKVTAVVLLAAATYSGYGFWLSWKGKLLLEESPIASVAVASKSAQKRVLPAKQTRGVAQQLDNDQGSFTSSEDEQVSQQREQLSVPDQKHESRIPVQEKKVAQPLLPQYKRKQQGAKKTVVLAEKKEQPLVVNRFARKQPPPLIQPQEVDDQVAEWLDEEALYKKGLAWFEQEIPKLKKQKIVKRIAEGDPFVLFVYWEAWDQMSALEKENLVNQLVTARENMGFEEVIEVRDASSNELFAHLGVE